MSEATLAKLKSMKGRFVILAALAGSAMTPLTRAQDADQPDRQQAALQQRVEQESIQANTTQISDQIAQINQELKDNGATDVEVRDIDTILKGLNKVTKEDMGKVITSLQSAADSTDTKRQDGALSSAYLGQANVLAKITLIAARLQQKQTFERMEAELQDMLQRQISNIRLSTAADALHNVMKSNDDWKTRGDAVQAQYILEPRYDALQPEVLLMLSKLPNGEGEALKGDIDKTGLADLSAQAQVAYESGYSSGVNGKIDTWKGDWPVAIKAENQIRGTLAALLVLIASKDPDTALQEASDALDHLIDQQEELMEATKTNSTAKLNPDQDVKAKTDLHDQQGTLEDATAALGTTLGALDPGAMPHLTNAGTAMDGSDKSLLAKDDNGSLGHQQNALDELKQAKDKLDAQIASMSGQAPPDAASPEDQLANAAQALDAAANSTAEGEDSLAQGNPEGANAAQSQLGDADNNLKQAQGTGALPAAAQSAVGDAEQALKDARNAAGKNDPKSGQGDAKKAADAIAKAQNAVAQELAAMGKGDGGGSTDIGSGGLGETPLQSGRTHIGKGQGDGSMNIGYYHGNYGRAAEVTALHTQSREAITQLPDQSVPSEFNGMVGQYFKNLANTPAP